MNQIRPVFLDLTKISLPLAALASILHRLSGFMIFLFIPFVLWLLQSVKTQTGFAELRHYLTYPLIKIFLWVVLSSIIYHFIAGIRHLLMDMHIGESREAGRLSAGIVIGLTVILSVLIGVWLW